MDYRKIAKAIFTHKEMVKNAILWASIALFILILAFALGVGPFAGSAKQAAHASKNMTNPSSAEEDAGVSEEDATDPKNIVVPNSSPTKTAIVVGDKALSFSHDPYTITSNDKPYAMVPVAEFLKAIEVQTTSYSSGNIIVAYRANMTSKFVYGSDLGYRNGKPYKLKSPIAGKNGVMYAPLDFIAKTYGYTLAEKNGVFYASPLPHTETFKSYDDMYYKSVSIPSLDASISVPQFWDKLSSSPLKYGFIDDTEIIDMETDSFSSSEQNASRAAEMYFQDFMQEKGIKIDAKKTLKVMGFDAFELDMSSIPSQTKKTVDYYSYFFIKNESSVYLLKFHTNSAKNRADYTKTFRNVASTFKIDTISISYDQEFYVEYDNFIYNGFKLKDELYSSKLVDGRMTLSGTFTSAPASKSMVMIVSKGNNSSWYKVNAKNGTFTSNIYLPYGLGKHNLTLFYVPTGASPASYQTFAAQKENKILEASLINVDPLELTFLTPSFFVNSDDSRIVNVSKLNTYKSLTQIDQAKNLYAWMNKNITIANKDSSKNSIDVLDTSTGSLQEANMLYCALLRSIGIPARVSTGESGGKTTYWTEVQLNGSWIVSNLTSEFSIPISEFYEGKKKIKRMEY